MQSDEKRPTDWRGWSFLVVLKDISMFDFSGISISPWQVVLLFAVVIAIMALLFVATAVVEKKKGIVRVTGTREITYGAVCLAAAFALSFIKLFSLPFGGSITLASVLPIGLYCYYFGFRKSMVVCFAFMLLQFFQNPYIVSPWSALLDYFLPFLAISLIGVFSYSPKKYENALMNNKPVVTAHLRILIGFGLYFVVRYLSHVLAGILFWSSGIDFMIWHGDLAGWAAVSYSLVYNIIYLLPDTLIAAGLSVVLLANKAFNAFMAKSFHAQKHSDTGTENNERAGSGADEG